MNLKLTIPLFLCFLIVIGRGLSLIPDTNAGIYSSGNGLYCLKSFPLKVNGEELIIRPLTLCRVGQDCELITMKEFPNATSGPLQFFLISNDGKFFLSINTLLPGTGKDQTGIKLDWAVEINFTDQAVRRVPPSVFEMTPDNETPSLTNRLWCNFDSLVYLDNKGLLHLETLVGQKWTYDIVKDTARKEEGVKQTN
jgi:hypothetical protein